jgi:thiol-disulfide isomerase/thioredoxin
MIKNLLSVLFLYCMAISSYGQEFSDDFESYDTGAYLAASSDVWTTWSGNGAGTAEDVRVVEERAYSGTKSIKFTGAAGGGPADVILPFGDKYVSGFFKFSSAFLIEENSNGYFNIQGEVNPGITWTMNTTFTADGLVEFTNSGNALITSSEYPIGEWFTLDIEANLTANIWNVEIDGNCIASFQSEINSVASLDLFPLDASSVFFVDDISFAYETEASVITNDIGIGSVELVGPIVGASGPIRASVTNNGTDGVLESFDASYTDGVSSGNASFTGLSVAPGESYDFVFDTDYTIQENINNITLRIANVNGTTTVDDNGCNDLQRVFFTPMTAREGKKVVIEEGTGTWCGFCPRGAVFMDAMDLKYPDHFIGIAVHNGTTDPMVIPAYDNALNFGTFPNSTTMRITEQDPSQIEPTILNFLSLPAVATFEIGALFDEDTRDLDISVLTTFQNNINGDYRLSVVIREDHANYNQVNYFAGGATVMGGYEDLPDPVPFTTMVHNLVARALLGGFGGQTISSNGAVAGDTRLVNFNYNVPADYDMENMKIIAILTQPGGAINNGELSSVDDALQNGFLLSSTQDPIVSEATHIYPNPVTDQMNVKLDLQEAQEVSISIFDAMGKLVAKRNYGKQSGQLLFPYNTADYDTGVYYLHITVGAKFTTKKIIVTK